MSVSIFACYVTLKSGARVSGFINAANHKDAREQIRNTAQGREASAVVVVRTH